MFVEGTGLKGWFTGRPKGQPATFDVPSRSLAGELGLELTKGDGPCPGPTGCMRVFVTSVGSHRATEVSILTDTGHLANWGGRAGKQRA